MLHLSCKITLGNLKIRCSKMQPLSGNQRRELLTCLMEMSFVLRVPCEMQVLQILFKRLTPAIVFETATKTHLNFVKVQNPLRLPRKTMLAKSGPNLVCVFTCFYHSDFDAYFFNISTPKSGPRPSSLQFLTSKCDSHHNGKRFLNISISKSAPKMMRF